MKLFLVAKDGRFSLFFKLFIHFEYVHRHMIYIACASLFLNFCRKYVIIYRRFFKNIFIRVTIQILLHILEVSMKTQKVFYGTISTIGGNPIKTEQQAKDYIRMRVDVGKNPDKWFPSEIDKIGEGRFVINEFYKKNVC